MQLIRSRLRTATCALLAVAGNAAAQGDWHFDAASLGYSEIGRVSVFEPVFSLKRDLANGRSVAGKITLDAITGASPTGATPSDKVQTVTSPSGVSTQVRKGVVPVNSFHDHRASFDLNFEQPLARTFKTVIGGHLSSEKDYLSRGATLTINWDTPDRLTTFSLGAGTNVDRVAPTGGRPLGLALTSTPDRFGSADKLSADGMLGVTRVLSPRWLIQLNYGRSRETGYLSEPYKIVSVVDANGTTIDFRNEKRPDRHNTQNVFLSSAYQAGDDVIHFSYRYYWDDWGIRSNTFDLKYRLDLSNGYYVEPHVRIYGQSGANFFTYGLVSGAPPPDYATADYRYGRLTTNTFGIKFGAPLGSGEFNTRAEYMLQSGDSHPAQAIGVQKQSDLFPLINILMLQVGYSLAF
jgi:hypothetical protein